MTIFRRSVLRLLTILGVALSVLVVPAVGTAVAQTVNRDDVLYILPFWTDFGGASDEAVRAEYADMKARLGPEGPYVKFGFSAYIFISMEDWNVDRSDPAAIRAALASTIAQIDAAIAKARAAGVPISLSILTAIRERYDPVQRASENEDIRSMQWYADNVVASGWWTHSRYARKAKAVQEAYIRELGKVVANRMSLYPDTLVAASGDGEVELAFARQNPITQVSDIYADYSPFVVAEFRDWIRHGGLYAPGAALAGQGYSLGSWYAGDLTPGLDTNGDGHTLNGDFGKNFQTWNLLHFDWSLGDAYLAGDPRAMPLATYPAPGLPGQVSGGFDAPREPQNVGTNAWWDLWVLFKQTMLQHHNTDFARWMTTSVDPATGATIPPARWYSYQIPSDYAFNGSPEYPTERFRSSMSSYWTGDISPYGSLGITAFNLDWPGCTLPPDQCPPTAPITYTLRNVAPRIAARDLRWGIIEWHPGVLPYDTGVSTNLELFRSEMSIVEQYRPSLLQPFAWGLAHSEVKGTAFETALKEMVATIKDGTPSNPMLQLESPTNGTRAQQPFVLSGWAADLGKIRGPGRGPGINQVDVYAYPNPGSQEAPVFLGSATFGSPRADVAAVYGTQFTNSGFALTVRNLPSGRYNIVAYGRSTVSQEFSVSRTVQVDLVASPTAPPFGLVDTPLQNANGVVGTIGVTGWALDDVGVAGVKIYRNCLSFEPPTNCAIVNGAQVVFVGDATLVAGARPDVEALYPTYPQANRAAWGYLLLTNLLPHVPNRQMFGGQGPVTLSALATDAEGKQVWLGRTLFDTTPTTIAMANDTIAVPFGAIDTPAQGQTVSGQVVNFGWALTPDSNTTAEAGDILVPLGGSTMQVFVDGVLQGTVAYNQCRGTVLGPMPAGVYCDDDVSSIFGNLTPLATFTPRTANVTKHRNLDVGRGAIGAFILNTTTLANGVHTIVWGVTDSGGRAEGIGSRYFTVLNSGADAGVGQGSLPTEVRGFSPADDRRAAGVVRASSPADAAGDTGAGGVMGVAQGFSPAVTARTGFDLGAPWVDLAADDAGVRRVQLPEFGRLELRLGPVDAGYLAANGELRDLPPGSHLDAATGHFTWAPGVGYYGTYRLTFTRAGAPIVLDVTIGPMAAVAPGEAEIRMHVDAPAAGAEVSGPFTVAGWALDPQAAFGSGIEAVHVWATRMDVAGAAPVYLGAAAVGGVRPDVAAVFGPPFGAAGFSLTSDVLASGRYEVTVYVWNRRTARWEDARTVAVTVR